MAAVHLSGINKHFGDTHVIRGVDIDIDDGMFCVLVGPSGCGKSTLLRMVAGLEAIDEGEISIGGTRRQRPAAQAARHRDGVPELRAVSAHDGARRTWRSRSTSRSVRRPRSSSRSSARADILGLVPYLDRYPRQLSGGQRQRVAMGRAIVRNPQVFLFDEPLSNLDAKLRVQMRTEIRELHQRLKATSIYVTHDQTEAMTMADKIVVLKDGVVEQAGRSARALRPSGQHVRRRLHRFAGDEPDARHRTRFRAARCVSTWVMAPRCHCPPTLALTTGRPCSTACGRNTSQPGASGLPVEVVVVEPTGADTQLYCKDLEGVWSAPTTSDRDRKELLRALLEEVSLSVEREQFNAHLMLRWRGGLLSEIDVPLPRSHPAPIRTAEDTIDLLRRLAEHYSDAIIAGILNRQGRTTATGLSFTANRVSSLRTHWNIPCFEPAQPANATQCVTVERAAQALGVAPSTLHRWLNDGFIAGEQVTPGAPWRIRLDDELRTRFVENVPEGYVTMLKATHLLGVSRQTILQRVKRGELHAVHVSCGRRKGLRIKLPAAHPDLFSPQSTAGGVV